MRLATFLEKNDALVRKVKGAMIYPGVIMSVAVDRHLRPAHLRHPDVPEHVRLGEPGAAAADARRDRDVADFLIAYWWVIIGIVAVAFFVIKRYYATSTGPAADRQADAQGARARRRAPEVGGVALHPDARHADLARASRSSRASRSRPRRPATA